MDTANAALTEVGKIVQAIAPVDLSGAANNGDWVSLKNYDRCLVIFVHAVGTAGDNPVFTLNQAQDVSGTNSKGLDFTTIQVMSQTALASSDAVTVVTQVAANTYQDTVGSNAAHEEIYVVEVKASDLDVNGGFDCLQLAIPDTGTNAQLGAAFYVLYGARYGGASLPSAITD